MPSWFADPGLAEVTLGFLKMQERLDRLYLNQIPLSQANLVALFEALKDSGAARDSLVELGLSGSVQFEEATSEACTPIVDFLGLHAPHLQQFDIRVRSY